MASLASSLAGLRPPPIYLAETNGTTMFQATTGPIDPGAHSLSVGYNPTGAQVDALRVLSVTSATVEIAVVAQTEVTPTVEYSIKLNDATTRRISTAT